MCAVSLVMLSWTAAADEHAMNPMFEGPLGLPDSRYASGTAWQPDSTPMNGVHFMASDWMLMPAFPHRRSSMSNPLAPLGLFFRLTPARMRM